jgi:hypothetical protein
VKKNVIAFLLLFVFSTIAFVAKQFLWFGELRVTGLSSYTTLAVDNNNKPILADEQSFKMRPGSYIVMLRGPMAKEQVTQTVRVSAFNTTEFQATTGFYSNEELISTLTDSDSSLGMSISDYYISKDYNWIIVRLFAKNQDREGYINIYHFTSANGWNLVESGTGFSADDLKKSDVPTDTLDYFEGNNDE